MHIRIACWNVGHQTRKKPIAPETIEAFLTLEPDVVVFTEYVVGPTHLPTMKTLASSGLEHAAHTEYVQGENQVLIACRWPLARADLKAPPFSSSTAPNFLHARCMQASLDIVALRVPMFNVSKQRTAYWEWLERTLQPLADDRRIVIGDLNVDPIRAKSVGGRHIASLVKSGWQVVTPMSGVSFFSKRGSTSRLDHALLGSGCCLERAEYITSAGGALLAGDRAPAYSDHAVLLVDISADA